MIPLVMISVSDFMGESSEEEDLRLMNCLKKLRKKMIWRNLLEAPKETDSKQNFRGRGKDFALMFLK